MKFVNNRNSRRGWLEGVLVSGSFMVGRVVSEGRCGVVRRGTSWYVGKD